MDKLMVYGVDIYQFQDSEEGMKIANGTQDLQ
jgi:hypothetical protein